MSTLLTTLLMDDTCTCVGMLRVGQYNVRLLRAIYVRLCLCLSVWVGSLVLLTHVHLMTPRLRVFGKGNVH